MKERTLTKTDFIHYLNCSKSLWLYKNKREQYPRQQFSEFLQKITREGYEVEKYAKQLFPQGVTLPTTPNAHERTKEELQKKTTTLFQPTFQTVDGLFARLDTLTMNEDGTYHLYEVKSTTEIKRKEKHNHIKDVAFQKIVTEKCGITIAKTFLVYLNKDYRRRPIIDPKELLVIKDITEEVLKLEGETALEMAAALALIKEPAIDETGCLCHLKTRSNHCDSFVYFNGSPEPRSIYELGRLSGKKLNLFLEQGIKKIYDIPDDFDLSDAQLQQRCSVRENQPIIDKESIQDIFKGYRFPLYFLDYETIQSAVPEILDTRPWQQIPFQFSLHCLKENSTLTHTEYLGESRDTVEAFVEALRKNIGPEGSVVSWNKAFEQMINRSIMEMYPQHRSVLEDINDRMVDLMDVFKLSYVDGEFCGSTSIKNVLPVMCPELSYKTLGVQDGTQAMSQWERLVDSDTTESEKEKIRYDLLEYCKLDTLAMVKLYQKLQEKIEYNI